MKGEIKNKLMIVEPIITSIVLALLITIVFALVLKNDGPWGAGVFFLVLFFVMWAGGLWLYPVGPYFWGVSWLPLLFIGLVTALLLATAKTNSTKKVSGHSNENPPNPRDGEKRSVVTVNEEEHKDAMAISIFFWVLMAVLVIAIIAGYWVQ